MQEIIKMGGIMQSLGVWASERGMEYDLGCENEVKIISN